MSATAVLKYTPDKLAQKLGNVSEAGEDDAAQLWASAKRLETEAILGKTSVQAVRRLNYWRKVLNQWEDRKLEARGIESGGGSMWSHLSQRNDAWIEKMLAKHMVELSKEREDQGKAFTIDLLKPINAIIDTGLKEFDDDQQDVKNHAKQLKLQLEDTFGNLQYLIRSLPEGKARAAVIEMVKPSSN